MVNKANFSRNVLSWFDKHGRHSLPWQKDATPYRVWVSEIMLQQTQVKTVLTYFEQFTHQFPTIFHLAKAPLDDVLSLWSGLGYYNRARNLHQCAQIICNKYHGEWPMDIALLEALPGIGRSTAGAIISLSHNHFAPILDGNVKRVLARFFAVEQWTGETKTQQWLWEKATVLTSQERPKDYNQAMMDLGAMICTRTKPNCPECPLRQECQAFQQEKNLGISVLMYPKKKIKKPVPIIHKQFLLILSHDASSLWLYKRPPVGVWGGLWSFPELEMEEDVKEWLDKNGFSAYQIETLSSRKHIFSHFVLHLYPLKICVKSISSRIHESSEAGWHSLDTPFPGGLPAPIMKLITEVKC